MLELTRTQARQIAVQAQLLDAPRRTDLLEVVRGLTLVQDDQTAHVARNADLVLWSRIGGTYSPEELRAALRGRALLELEGMLRPAEDLALYRADMAAWVSHRPDWITQNAAFRDDVLARLASDGPLVAAELPDSCVVPWTSSGWNNGRNVTMMIASLVARGEVAAAGRRGREQLWDLASRVYPDDPVVPADEARAQRDALRLKALGLARAKAPVTASEPNDVREAGQSCTVEGVKGVWRVEPSLLGRPFVGRVAVLSPLDRLVFDRKRVLELFGFDYQLEMYKPAAKRRWGYFALPVLYGERLVGKVDATSDRRAGVFRVDAIHQDVAFDRAMTEEIEDEVAALADWLELELVMPKS